jgi:hypothetical protein
MVLLLRSYIFYYGIPVLLSLGCTIQDGNTPPAMIVRERVGRMERFTPMYHTTTEILSRARRV